MRHLPAIFIIALAVAACGDDKPVGTTDIDVAHTPTMLTRNVETLISDSGITRFRITAPVWYVFDETDTPVWRFPESLLLERFDENMKVEATVSADSATYFKNTQLWRLDGNVRISNLEGEKFLTAQLFWDQGYHRVYSDSFIHIERRDKTLEGHGFTSNEQLTRYTIHNVSGIFPASTFSSPSTRASHPNDSTR